MIHLTVSYQHPNRQIIDIEMVIDNNSESVELQMPAWRPGRYELGNFAKNIQRFEVFDGQQRSLPFRKLTKDRWTIEASRTKQVIVKYSIYAAEISGGSTWLDDEQLYINFINCALYLVDRDQEPYTVKLNIPDHYKIACGLKKESKHTLVADSFYHLVESPLIASASLTHWQYEVANCTFHLWFQGAVHLDEVSTIRHFKKFTHTQINTIGSFPSQDYHFLFQLLPYRAYHGVEHYNSTVIILGPTEKLQHDSPMYHDLIGVSSHELFHTWNIIRIRPAEMMPYDYTRENYFPTGYVAEGVTTYYGDLFLARSGVIDKAAYFGDLNKLFKRHFDNYGRHNYSLTASSQDLWLDGYVAGIPHRKVSIYVKGAIISLMLDLKLRLITQGKSSLNNLMTTLWERFGKTGQGYTHQDIVDICSALAGESLVTFFESYVEGTVPVEEKLTALLRTVGCDLRVDNSENLNESQYGFKTVEREGNLIVTNIAPGSPADYKLSRGDQIISLNGQQVNSLEDVPTSEKRVNEITILRRHKRIEVNLEPNDGSYFKQFTIMQRKDALPNEKEGFTQWCGLEW